MLHSKLFLLSILLDIHYLFEGKADIDGCLLKKRYGWWYNELLVCGLNADLESLLGKKLFSFDFLLLYCSLPHHSCLHSH